MFNVIKLADIFNIVEGDTEMVITSVEGEEAKTAARRYGNAKGEETLSETYGKVWEFTIWEGKMVITVYI